MNKSDFITKFAKNLGTTKAFAEKTTDAFLNTITEILESGDTVKFHGFGKFENSIRKARTCTDVRYGTKIDIEESILPTFRAGLPLKTRVRQSYALRAAEADFGTKTKTRAEAKARAKAKAKARTESKSLAKINNDIKPMSKNNIKTLAATTIKPKNTSQKNKNKTKK